MGAEERTLQLPYVSVLPAAKTQNEAGSLDSCVFLYPSAMIFCNFAPPFFDRYSLWKQSKPTMRKIHD